MPTINEYFDKVICINLDRRTDRWSHVEAQCDKHNLVLERFVGLDLPGDGNRGCTESHAAVLRRIVEAGWERTLILEDDFEFRFDNSQELFGQIIGQLPADSFMVYLGGHYADYANTRFSKNLVRFTYMKTTSSYGVTLESAKEMAPHIGGPCAIDELYTQWHRTKPCYIFCPRLVVQYENYSDLQRAVMNNAACMEDRQHEDKLGMFDP